MVLLLVLLLLRKRLVLSSLEPPARSSPKFLCSRPTVRSSWTSQGQGGVRATVKGAESLLLLANESRYTQARCPLTAGERHSWGFHGQCNSSTEAAISQKRIRAFSWRQQYGSPPTHSGCVLLGTIPCVCLVTKQQSSSYVFQHENSSFKTICEKKAGVHLGA